MSHFKDSELLPFKNKKESDLSMEEKKKLYFSMLVNNHNYPLTKKMKGKEENENVEICNSSDFASESRSSIDEVIDIDVNVLTHHSKSSLSKESIRQIEERKADSVEPKDMTFQREFSSVDANGSSNSSKDSNMLRGSLCILKEPIVQIEEEEGELEQVCSCKTNILVVDDT